MLLLKVLGEVNVVTLARELPASTDSVIVVYNTKVKAFLEIAVEIRGRRWAFSLSVMLLMSYQNTGEVIKARGDELSYAPVTPDRFVDNGDRVEMGGLSLTPRLTPGHTKGCTSWSMRANEDGKDYDVLVLCGLTVSPYKLTNNDHYPDIVQDAQTSLMNLRRMHVDVLLAAHASGLTSNEKLHAKKKVPPIHLLTLTNWARTLQT